ncbi:MAG TPA: glycosyltransferase family 39 protein [Candidatus Polarisedimenticolia bacterium]|nr:glycosyltransferase family 39 protein [Candidatus Polarisedimenticolia bacterium]
MVPAIAAAQGAETKSHGRFASGPAIVLYLALAKLLLHLLTAARYGIFRDEMYYLACSQHLAWGYVDHPPMAVFIAWFARHVFGESLLGLRLLPAIAGAALVWMAGLLAREMGGGRFAQALAALAVIPVPVYLILHHWLTMNAFEPLIWMGCLWCVLRAIDRGEPRYWFWFGALAGVGLETKYSIAFLVFGVFVGAVLGPERRFFKSRWLWLGMLAAALIALPNFLWQLRHDFPFLQLIHNIRMTHRDIVRGPVGFLADQAVIMDPILLPLWVGGLLWLFFGREGRRYRLFGWTYLVVVASFIALKGKNYYVAPIYPILFAAGAVGFERITSRSFAWSRAAYVAAIVVVGAVLAPISCPILSPENYVRYQAALGFTPPAAERQNNGPLPQYFADEFGWEEMVQQVARVYDALPPGERARTAIFCNGWGEAAAIDFFGPRYGLPRAISNHNNYWYWGPRNYTGEIVIVLGSTGRGDREHFRSVEAAGRVEHPYSRRDEHFTIWLCRGLNQNLQDLWPKLKKFS